MTNNTPKPAPPGQTTLKPPKTRYTVSAMAGLLGSSLIVLLFEVLVNSTDVALVVAALPVAIFPFILGLIYHFDNLEAAYCKYSFVGGFLAGNVVLLLQMAYVEGPWRYSHLTVTIEAVMVGFFVGAMHGQAKLEHRTIDGLKYEGKL